MSNAVNNWYVITGGPSTGKTTLLAELEKLGYKTIPEAARSVIDEAIASGKTVAELRADEHAFQDEVMRKKVTTEAEHTPQELLFFDRGMQDTLAYLRAYDFNLEDWVLEQMQSARYQKVFLLDTLPNFQSDYARTEDKEFSVRLRELLRDAYSEFGMEPIIVPVASPAERAKFVIDLVDGVRL